MTEETFGPYRIEQLLGRGGMGEVHRAYDTVHDRVVALKRLSPAYHGDEEFRARFRREAQIVARLREPHVIPIHAYGEIDERLYLDMRLVEGADLSDLIKEEPLEPARAVRIVEQVASALDAAHADGLVHRDVKPSNVLVTSGDFVYLVDFGIARSASPTATSLTASGSVVGTLDYMAPERFDSGPVDGRADVYALACVLFVCVTGRRPFTAEDTAAQIWAHLKENPPKASPLNPAVPPALDEVIAKGMAKAPADRYATAGDLARAAAQALAVPPRPAPPAPVTPSSGQPPVTPPSGQPPVTPPSGQPPVPHPPAARPGPVPPRQYVPTSPLPPGPHQYGTPPHGTPHPFQPRSSSESLTSAQRGVLVVTAFVVVIGVVAALLYFTNEKVRGAGTPSGTPSSTTTTTITTTGSTSESTTTTTTTTTPTRSPQDDALLAALPSAYSPSSCELIEPDAGAISAVRCTGGEPTFNSFPPPDSAEFRLFSDRASQDAFFQALVTTRGIPRRDDRGGCRPLVDAVHYALYYRSEAGPLPGEFVTCFVDAGVGELWWVDSQKLTIGVLRKQGDATTLDKLDGWWNQSILSTL